jgi:hypothetical protein
VKFRPRFKISDQAKNALDVGSLVLVVTWALGQLSRLLAERADRLDELDAAIAERLDQLAALDAGPGDVDPEAAWEIPTHPDNENEAKG